MRIFLNIICVLGSIVCLVLGAAFAFVELRALFAQDWLLAYNPNFALFRYILRSFYFVCLSLCGLVTIILGGLRKAGPIFFLGLMFGVFSTSFVSFTFYEWYFALALCVGSGLMLFGHTVRSYGWD